MIVTVRTLFQLLGSLIFAALLNSEPAHSFVSKSKTLGRYCLTDAMTEMSRCGDDAESDKVRVLGVCGGIGSGKSTVCQVLVSEFGCLGHIGKTNE